MIKRDEAFVCAHCGRRVPPAGRTSRNHCPSCLRSLHVDVVPGDRADPCGGIMDPISADVRTDRVTIVHRCRRCGAERRVRALRESVADPDDWEALVRVAAGAG